MPAVVRREFRQTSEGFLRLAASWDVSTINTVRTNLYLLYLLYVLHFEYQLNGGRIWSYPIRTLPKAHGTAAARKLHVGQPAAACESLNLISNVRSLKFESV